VAKTAPYSHSGSTYDLEAAIRAHGDPLGVADVARMRPAERVEFYKRLALWSREPVHGVHLTDDEVRSLRSFLEI
jgi:cytochrome c peroxidase